VRMRLTGVGRTDRLVAAHPVLSFFGVVAIYGLMSAVFTVATGHWAWSGLLILGVVNAALLVGKSRRLVRQLP
jgi:hypothetical protein